MTFKSYTGEQKTGLIGTVLFHLFLLICFLMYGLTSLDPPPDSGIALNFGTSDFGMGEIQPEETSSSEITPTDPDIVDAAPVESNTVEEEVITQDAVKTVEVPKEEKKEKTEEKKPEISDKLKQTLSNAFTKKSTTGSEGTDNKNGDKGKVDGTKDGSSYDGKGDEGNGYSYNLSDRDHLSIPKPIDKSQEEGKVVVQIYVDPSGNVIKVKAGVKGTTTTNKTLWNKAGDAALKAKFTPNSNAPEQQTGTITYIFVIG